ncbi:hypothetical protein GUITHDRAFT_164877 [Guillardia theta CCMP2712]|uniref:Uncharacterized protein n=1 Tax=Guillardia theta (strain CCMP2712) TaxID=905079 RepID=L1IU05_GUITC|nr:hypothetical protein GUITHDRAFT_164877 [Guillardia theta CCMP2712]EKX39746.1 hypothetical protein GUITHDRAFT_164877 [Guillardia theta CCMP2712]|eukprot:XP_005826726.1 hypothetical protein GUITHDRAFT_164877 [Guillardia theta CCMP2712]
MGLRAAAVFAALVLCPLLLVERMPSLIFQRGDVLLAQQRGARVSSLEQFGGQKVQWEPLRPEHPQYYPNVIYLYTGPETSLYGHSNSITNFKSVLRKDHPEVMVKTFGDFRTATIRAAAWDEAAHTIVFPSFTDYPDLHMISKTDLRGYASSGNNIVFLGGFGSLSVINEIFGWQIRPVEYQVTKAALEDAVLICPTGQDGPFYRSKRNVHNTVFAGMPSMLESGRDNRIYGVHLGSLPPGARSYYDSIGDSVVWSVRYDLGMITYVGNSMEALTGEAHHTSDGPCSLCDHGSPSAQWRRILQAAVAL